jgi:hypothetical protein
MSITITWETVQNLQDPEGGDLRETRINGLIIDAVLDESLIVESEISRRPSEVGMPHSDAKQRKPKIENLECIVSNEPRDANELGATHESIELPSGRSASVVVYTEEQRRVDRATQALIALCDGHVEVDIDGLLVDVEKWQISSFTPGRTTDISSAMKFGLKIEEILKAQLTEVQAPSPRVERGRRRRDNGTQTPTGDSASSGDTVSNNPQTRGSYLANLRTISSRALPAFRGLTNIIFGRATQNDPGATTGTGGSQ